MRMSKSSAPKTASAPAGQPVAPSQRRATTRVSFGWDAERQSLREAEAVSSAKRVLEESNDVLPELEHAPSVQRPLWRHPAFLVSMGATILAAAATVVFLILGSGDQAAASKAELVVSPGNAHLTWQGSDVAYDLFVVGGPSGDVVDASQLVRGSREAWIPQAAGIIDAESCFVVRPSAVTAEVSLDPATLESQGAVAACIADADK